MVEYTVWRLKYNGAVIELGETRRDVEVAARGLVARTGVDRELFTVSKVGGPERKVRWDRV